MVSDFVVTQRHVNQQSGFVVTDSIGMGGYNTATILDEPPA